MNVRIRTPDGNFMLFIKNIVRASLFRVPFLGPILSRLLGKFSNFLPRFGSSEKYWELWYAKGGGSGEGSVADRADWKALFLNKFVSDNNVSSVVEWGSGDGQQLEQARYPKYIGVDVSPTAISRCKEKIL